MHNLLSSNSECIFVSLALSLVRMAWSVAVSRESICVSEYRIGTSKLNDLLHSALD